VVRVSTIASSNPDIEFTRACHSILYSAMTPGRAEWGYKMTATLLVVVPVVLLLLIGTFCFVGCTLDTSGLGLGFVQYSDLDVILNPDCVAYWQLRDSPGQTTALDVVGKAKDNPHNGTYKSVASTDPMVQALFPCVAGEVNPTTHSAFAPGTVTLNAEGIVIGDTEIPHDPKNPISTPCVKFDGGFVTVPANATCNPSVFTIECWARREWPDSDGPAHRMVCDSRDSAGGVLSGYGLWVNDNGNWEAILGASSNASFTLITGGLAKLDANTHLVLTYDGEFASLFIDGDRVGVATQVLGFTQNTTQPLTFGVGLARLPPRTSPADFLFFPLFPFKGRIQDIAIYKTVLDDTTIKNHSEHGNGKATG
jgi:hypothetical protein